MKRVLAILLVLIIALSLSACHKHKWEPATCDAPKTCSVCGKTSGDPLGHKWGEPSYEWSDDLSSITASRVCANDPAHVESETVEVQVEELRAATCTEAGESSFTASFENPVFAAQSRTEALPEALGHKWGEPVYEWSDDMSSVTATRICENDPSHVETEIADVTAEVTKAATCEERGETTYSVVFGNEGFSAQSRTEADVEPLGHVWGEPSYEWSDDMSSVTATRVCEIDPSHVETETAEVTAEVTRPASAGDPGETSYSAVFGNGAFSIQSRVEAGVKSVDASMGEAGTEPGGTATGEAGTEPGGTATGEAGSESGGTATGEAGAESGGAAAREPVYAWSEDMSSVTVTYVGEDGSEQVETAEVTTEVTKAATCEEPGETTYTAAFAGEAFPSQSRTEADIPALGHVWGEPVYEWSEDLSSVTATRVCENDPSHVETETAEVTAEVTKPAACEEPGETTYTAVFANEAFAAQTRTEADIDAVGHAWGEPSYEWSEDLSSVTATRVCANDPAHVETETVASGAEVTKPATCVDMGQTTYTAVFTNEAFAGQTRTETDVPALGHDWLKATHTAPATCAVCGETEGGPLPIHYFAKSFKEWRHDFEHSYPAFLSIEPSKKGWTVHVTGETMTRRGLDELIRFYHADEFYPGSRKSLDKLKRFNMIEISYLSDSEAFDTSISARIAQIGYYAAKVLDPSLGQTAFFKEGLDLFDAKGNEQSFIHNGFVYKLSCAQEGSGYRYAFTMTLEDNLE